MVKKRADTSVNDKSFKVLVSIEIIQAFFFVLIGIILLSFGITILSDINRAAEFFLQGLVRNQIPLGDLRIENLPDYVGALGKTSVAVAVVLILLSILLVVFSFGFLKQKTWSKKALIFTNLVIGLLFLSVLSTASAYSFLIPMIFIIINFGAVFFILSNPLVKKTFKKR